MFVQKSKDSGVSPVVGVILMVALTVVLSAVLGQFVFDIVSVLNEPPQAGVSFQENGEVAAGNQVTVVVNSLPNAEEVQVQPSPPVDYTGGGLAGMTLDEVGQSKTETYPEGTFLTVVAYQNGNSVVIQTYTVGQ